VGDSGPHLCPFTEKISPSGHRYRWGSMMSAVETQKQSQKWWQSPWATRPDLEHFDAPVFDPASVVVELAVVGLGAGVVETAVVGAAVVGAAVVGAAVVVAGVVATVVVGALEVSPT